VSVLFIKPGYTTADCSNPDAYVAIAAGESSTPADLQALFGTSTPSAATFVACIVLDRVVEASQFYINVTWEEN
jgi:hypothetical protein